MDIINSEKDIIRAILRTLLTEHNDDDIENNTDFFKLLDEVGNDSDENDSRGFISDSDSNDVSNLEKYAFVDETRLPNSRIKFGKQREEVTHDTSVTVVKLKRTERPLTNSTPEVKGQTPDECFTPDFDYMFNNPSEWLRNIHNFELFGTTAGDAFEEDECFSEDTCRLPTEDIEDSVSHVKSLNNSDKVSPSHDYCISTRCDYIKSLTFLEMLMKNAQYSQGFCGFRRKMTAQMGHKYCSYYFCDGMIFIFLYVVLGMAYLSLGVFGLTYCSNDQFINYFLICDGTLSVFLFPITIMEWSSHIGGCNSGGQKQTMKDCFCSLTILIFRLGAAVCGSYLIVTQNKILQSDNTVCVSTFYLLKVGVVLEWSFFFVAVALPFIVYSVMYLCAKRFNQTQYGTCV